MAEIGFGVTLRGYEFPEWKFTFTLASGITTSDIGKAVALDTGAANKVKLAGDGDVIVGRLETVENRTQAGILVGTVSLKFADRLPVKSGLTGAEVVAVGSSVVGAGSGEVKARVVSAAATPDYNDNIVVEIQSTYAVVIKK